MKGTFGVLLAVLLGCLILVARSERRPYGHWRGNAIGRYGNKFKNLTLPEPTGDIPVAIPIVGFRRHPGLTGLTNGTSENGGKLNWRTGLRNRTHWM
ncbi:hypothetical protein ACJMK2_027222 [Sinanodonta woodiana]|uniref:Secreted protein n=1 Tax=Sinanodonta woodiana TaxID=1069815 RepID=A0ABD3XM65_SINWO